MSGTELLITVAGSVALLLWGTRMARTGFLRAFGAELRSMLATATRNRVRAAATGMASAGLLQSSTATALLAASFAGAGLLDVPAGLAIMLGADVGSALVAQLFSLRITGFWPVLVFVGFVIHASFYERSARIKQFGRIALGLGLMLLALHLLSNAAGALRESALLATIFSALGNEPLLAILVAAITTWLAHSSLAVILLIASMTGAGVIALPLALILVLGVNAGAAIPAFVITLRQSPPALRIALGNLLFRFIGVAATAPLLGYVIPLLQGITDQPGVQAMLLHIGFNVGLLVVFLGLTGPFGRLTERIVADQPVADEPGEPRYLDETAGELPSVALSLAARETLHMGDIVDTMLRQAMEALENNDERLCSTIKGMDDQVDRLYEAIKLYLTGVSREQLDKGEAARCFEIIAFVANLENIGDTIEKSLIDSALAKIRQRKSFSEEGMNELREMHDYVLATVQLALSVFMERDVEAARELLLRKDAFRQIELDSTESHLDRLRGGRIESVETSAIHIDIMRDLKRINSHLASVAYPILDAAGQLRRTRLKKA